MKMKLGKSEVIYNPATGEFRTTYHQTKEEAIASYARLVEEQSTI